MVLLYVFLVAPKHKPARLFIGISRVARFGAGLDYLICWAGVLSVHCVGQAHTVPRVFTFTDSVCRTRIDAGLSLMSPLRSGLPLGSWVCRAVASNDKPGDFKR